MGFASINLQDGPIQGAAKTIELTGNTTLSTATHSGAVLYVTAPADLTMWECETTNGGTFFTVWVKDASEAVSLLRTGSTDVSYLYGQTSGIAAGNEMDMPTTGNQRATFMCNPEGDRWDVVSQTAAVTDGGGS